jgi:hypothetical protein
MNQDTADQIQLDVSADLLHEFLEASFEEAPEHPEFGAMRLSTERLYVVPCLDETFKLPAPLDSESQSYKLMALHPEGEFLEVAPRHFMGIIPATIAIINLVVTRDLFGTANRMLTERLDPTNQSPEELL